MRSLKVIQFFSRLGKILSRIIGVLSIIMALICAFCVLGIAFLPNDTFEFGGITIGSLMSESHKLNLGEVYTSLTVYIIMCSGETVLCALSARFFAGELRAGTPFTAECANGLLRLGILTVIVPIVTMLAAALVGTVMSNCFGGIDELNIQSFLSVGVGVIFIVLSLICKYVVRWTEKSSEALIPD